MRWTVLLIWSLTAATASAHSPTDFELVDPTLSVRLVFDGDELGLTAADPDVGGRILAGGALLIVSPGMLGFEGGGWELKRLNSDGSIDVLARVPRAAPDGCHSFAGDPPFLSDPCSGLIWFRNPCPESYRMQYWVIEGLPSNRCQASSLDGFSRLQTRVEGAAPDAP